MCKREEEAVELQSEKRLQPRIEGDVGVVGGGGFTGLGKKEAQNEDILFLQELQHNFNFGSADYFPFDNDQSFYEGWGSVGGEQPYSFIYPQYLSIGDSSFFSPAPSTTHVHK